MTYYIFNILPEHLRYFVPHVDKLLKEEKNLQGDDWEKCLEENGAKYGKWEEVSYLLAS